MFVFDTLIDGVANVAEKYLTNKGDKEKFLADLKQNEIELRKMSLVQNHEINKSKLTLVGKMIEKGCIPALFWLFILIEGNNNILVPYLQYFTGDVFPIIHPSPEYYSLLKVVTASLFAKKGASKYIESRK